MKRRLVASAREEGLESLRYMNSAAAWSHDGRYIAFSAKAGGQDALNIYDVRRNRIAKRLKFDINGISTPSWSPDGNRIVFTGLDGGISDLFVTDLEGRVERLTNDKYADLLPSWSPDGKRIAFTTDRANTDLKNLQYGNMRVAVLDMDTRGVDVLPHQDEGKNLNAMWSPDGQKLIWVSDRTGTNNLYLYDIAQRELSRITDVLSGVIAISALSPVISWSKSGRLAFTYFESAGYNAYVVEDPLTLPRLPVRRAPVIASGDAAGRQQSPAIQTAAAAPRPRPDTVSRGGFVSSYYRNAEG